MSNMVCTRNFIPNGQLATKLNYIYGEPHRLSSQFDFKGNLISEYSYNMGRLDGKCSLVQ